MAIVGFNFTKMRVERTEAPKGKLGVKHNVGIKNVEKADFSLGKSNQGGVRFHFEFNINYEPNVGSMLLEGELVDILPEKEAKKLIERWKKEKIIEPKRMENLLNTIYTKCNVQALILSKDINLPPPIKIPRINVKINEKKK